MLLTTTSSIEGKNIKEYMGIVFGEVVNGVNFINDFTAMITNFTGGRSSEYEQELVDARANALKEMMQRAEKIGANAVIGVKFDYEPITIGDHGTMLTIMVSGTAVVVE